MTRFTGLVASFAAASIVLTPVAFGQSNTDSFVTSPANETGPAGISGQQPASQGLFTVTRGSSPEESSPATTQQPAARQPSQNQVEGQAANTVPPAEAAASLKAFESSIVGTWARLGSRDITGVSQRLLLKAQQSCMLPSEELGQFKVSEGAETIAASATGSGGDLIYYRTDSGLQRMDNERQRIDLVENVVPQKGGPTGTFFQFNAGSTVLRVVFNGGPQSAERTGSLMIEENSMYILCPPNAVAQNNG